MLRDYQERAIADLWKWFEHNSGNPCLMLPPGSGKSHIIASICKEAVQSYPDTKILMLTHVQELIEQNAEKLRQHWANAPLGIYSAGLKQTDIDQITYAGVQSVRRRAAEIGHIDLCIIDEAHTINHKDSGGYRQLINDLTEINPKLKVIGLTATPYRLGHGMITDDPAIFDDILEPVTVEELQRSGYLATLKSKVTHRKLSTDGVHKRGGEYIERELQAIVDTDDNNAAVVAEVVKLAENRKHWLFFCTGVAHAEHVRDIVRSYGITAETVTGKTPKPERERILSDYKAGKIQALTSVAVLTTGFDYPDIDLIVMMRPTMSPGLYVQMAGRGLRLKSHTDHCLVLDFAGVVEQHGPITSVRTPAKAGEGGIAPCKVCPDCDEIIHASVMTCPQCGYIFPPSAKDPLTLHNDDIQGSGLLSMRVTGWLWSLYTSKTSGKEMIRVAYYGALNEHDMYEYLCVMHGGFTGYKAMEVLRSIAETVGADIMQDSVENLCKEMNRKTPPTEVIYKKDGRWSRVIDRLWTEKEEEKEEEFEDIFF